MKPADVTEATDDLAANIINVVTELHDRNALDMAWPVVFGHLERHRIAAFEAGRVAGLEEAAKVADIAASNATNRMNVIRYGAEECEHAKDHLEYAASAIRALKEKNDG